MNLDFSTSLHGAYGMDTSGKSSVEGTLGSIDTADRM